MILRSAFDIVKRVSFVGVLAVSIWLLAGTLANGQAPTASATSTAATKKTIQTAQERLLALGYQPGSADGVMGAKATAAVKKFQSDHALPVTGQLGRKTLDALNTEGRKAPNAGAGKDGVAGEQYEVANDHPNYRELTKDDGLECHVYTTMVSSLTSPSSGSLSSGGRSFECIDASGKRRAIGLTAIQYLGDEKVAIVTKDFGTMYSRDVETCVPSTTETNKDGAPIKHCTYQDMYEMTDIQIRKLKLLLGL
jgi:peptidoglycan hydrolase-like protein with peptidoglycan-binding domain